MSAETASYDSCATSFPRHRIRSHHAGVRFFFSSLALTFTPPSSPPASPSSPPTSPDPLYVLVPGRYLYVGGNVTGASVHPAARAAACSRTADRSRATTRAPRRDGGAHHVVRKVQSIVQITDPNRRERVPDRRGAFRGAVRGRHERRGKRQLGRDFAVILALRLAAPPYFRRRGANR